MKSCLIYTIFALSTYFHVAAGLRQLKSTLNTDSGIYQTLVSEDQPSASVTPPSNPDSNLRHSKKRRALKAAGRISYGQEAGAKQFPYVVYFDIEGDSLCTGSVIAPRVILTAAHCVYDEDTDGFINKDTSRIYFGSADYDYTTEAEIKALYMPKQYSQSGSSNLGDVGLVELVDPIPSSIKPVALASAATKMPAGTTLTVVGWGEMETGEFPDHLMYTTGKVMDKAECETVHYDTFDYELDADHFCVAVPQDTMQTTCGGDSGGPYLMIQPGKPAVQVGATSFGPSGDCGSEMNVDVPVSIKYWRTWIDNTMSMYNMKGASAPLKRNTPAVNQCFGGGTVLATKVTTTYGKCLEMCRNASMVACKAWTWKENGDCTLLTAKGSVTKSIECTSGYFK